jgi:hypothetical protein
VKIVSAYIGETFISKKELKSLTFMSGFKDQNWLIWQYRGKI